jgi:hypothetical protein
VLLTYRIELNLKLGHIRARLGEGQHAAAGPQQHGAGAGLRMPCREHLRSVMAAQLRNSCTFLAVYTYSMYSLLGPWLAPQACGPG